MKFAKITTNLAAAMFALTAVSHAVAQSHSHDQPAAVASQAAALSEGEIKKVDKGTGRLTIQHGPLENLGMPGMTMIFGVKDASMLEALNAGDNVKFVAEKLNGRFVVTQLTVQK